MAEAPESQTETQPEQQAGQDQDQELELFRTRELLRGEEISYASAKEKDSNLLHRLSYCDKRNEFFGKIYANYYNIKRSLLAILAFNHYSLSISLTTRNGCTAVSTSVSEFRSSRKKKTPRCNLLCDLPRPSKLETCHSQAMRMKKYEQKPVLMHGYKRIAPR